MYAGTNAARSLSTNGTLAYARKTLGCEQPSLFFQTRFKIVSKDATSYYLLKFRSTADASIGGVYVDANRGSPTAATGATSTW